MSIRFTLSPVLFNAHIPVLFNAHISVLFNTHVHVLFNADVPVLFNTHVHVLFNADIPVLFNVHLPVHDMPSVILNMVIFNFDLHLISLFGSLHFRHLLVLKCWILNLGLLYH